MDFKKKKEELEKEFNKNRDEISVLQQKINILNGEQLKLVGKFQQVGELEKELNEHNGNNKSNR